MGKSEARSLIGLSQSIRTMDVVDDLMQKFEQPDVDLEQTNEDNLKPVKAQPTPKQKTLVAKPIIKINK
jgi:hypothetical protein